MVSVVSLVGAFVYALARVKLDGHLILVLKFWVAASFITTSYILIGVINGAPNESVTQVFVIYVISPFLWIYVAKSFVDMIPLDVAVRKLIVVSVFACLTVFLFYYLFLSYGANAVGFFIEAPNVDLGTEGYVAATMYVFGSLIFLLGGYCSAFLVAGGWKKWLLLLFFITTALISGRSALMLAVVIGLLISVIATLPAIKKRIGFGFIRGGLLLSFACIVLFSILNYFGLSFVDLILPLIEKTLSFGGEGRHQQFFALASGISDNLGFGSGHGIGVDYQVSDKYPWRYEMVWVATVYRVGVFGAIVYFAPFFLSFLIGFRGLIKGRLSQSEIYVLGGGVCAFVASNTNPYIESFVFQWMYVLPVMYFLGFVRKQQG